MRTNWTGVGTALVTPFTKAGDLDEQAIRRLGRRQIDAGIHFLVPCGTTGENPTLTLAERRRIVEVLADEAAGQTPVLAGAGGYDTKEIIHLADEMRKAGASGLLSVTPYYNKPTQEGMYRHFRAIAESVDIPVILYNVPGRTVADMSNDTTLRLAEIPNIVGIKDATGDIGRACDLVLRAPQGFALYSGDDPTGMAFMLCGGHGVISVTANVAPRLMSELCQAALAGDTARARAINDKLQGLHKHLFIEPNPIPAKWALQQMGRIPDGLRLPLTPLTDAATTAVRAAMQQAEVL
jgi:4-hydroxy-tetrahydrodipicolinate synthase